MHSNQAKVSDNKNTRSPAASSCIGQDAQSKLDSDTSNDRLENESAGMAGRMMRIPDPLVQRKCAACEEEDRQLQRKPLSGTETNSVPDNFMTALNNSRPLDDTTKDFFEPRFGSDLSKVRIHTGEQAAESARSIGAQAYTLGNDVVFGAGAYQPGTIPGKKLIAHELSHVLQQGEVARRALPNTLLRYTDAQRREMAEGRVQGQANDLAMAAQRHFEPGDIVFRRGSAALAWLTGLPVTHGGIYIGNGLIHDVVAFGNRHVRVTNFFNPALGEAADSNTCRIARFIGPSHQLIVDRLIANIGRRDFRMPTDPVPFNLFSSADDYRTATCLEYAHAQFLYAIRQLSTDQSVSLSDRQSLRTTYFAGQAAEPNALIQPREQRLFGNMADPSSMGSSGPFSPPPRTLSALTQEAALVGAASAMASDNDPGRFRNRSESRYQQHWPGSSGFAGTLMNLLMGPTHDEVVLRTFTYQSFVDSRRFFQVITP